MATNAFSAPPPNTTVPQLIEAIWRHVHYRINSGDVNNIVLPLNFKAVIGQQGMEVIVNRFKRSIQAPVTMLENGNAIFLKPTASPDGKITVFDDVSVQSQPKKVDKSKVPRPPNAFILYRQHHHPIIKSENPDMHNNQISVILGQQWKNEDELTIRYYKRKAEVLKLKHLKDHPEYSYQPRKPTEKKRRMTSKKAAVLAEISDVLMSSNTMDFATSSVLSSSLEITNDAHHTEAAPVAHTTAPSTLNQTEGGNAIFTLGDADLDDEEFAAMLEAYNNNLNITINPLQAMLPPAAQNPPIIYSERVGEEQDNFNFENNAIDWNEFLVEADQFASELETAFAASSIPLDSMTEAQRTALYDSNNAFLRNAEANRSNNITNGTGS